MKYQIVSVVYTTKVNAVETQRYNFKCPISLGIVKDDMVVVDSVNGLGIAKVMAIYDNIFENAKEANKATAWVVSKIDVTSHIERMKIEEKRKWLIKQLKERQETAQEIAIYELIAKTDSTAQKLLEELKAIDGEK